MSNEVSELMDRLNDVVAILGFQILTEIHEYSEYLIVNKTFRIYRDEDRSSFTDTLFGTCPKVWAIEDTDGNMIGKFPKSDDAIQAVILEVIKVDIQKALSELP